MEQWKAGPKKWQQHIDVIGRRKVGNETIKKSSPDMGKGLLLSYLCATMAVPSPFRSSSRT